ncbi:peptide chain release factor N(5)-glutamine methyltransferase [Aurantiacibacter marinus]|uniref:Release factor glutamine methyltransferase n=1 Tax=Aurantiacibacter marinus TaxID=874156 RepID=A0A0H0XQN8_9SPHN|nr:peptide chain release factor N(5)-glutamine methyltransferase [Aurantiacibacter marinus]KLI64903.1 SAM-dependent methyltransferase [Aurantiacibacter marinus]
MSDGTRVTVAAAIRDAAQRLSQTSGTARLDAELLMAQALGSSRSDLLLRHMRDTAPGAFEALISRRAANEPVAYILGVQEFYGREFMVTPDVLIPRADSESVVQAALEAAPEPRRVLDCGTGSGALLLTLLAERSDARGVGIDSSPAALEVARRNAVALGVTQRAQMLEKDWTKAGWADAFGTFDLIIANPPYVEVDADLSPDVRAYEPPQALFSGPEGLDDYRILIPQLPQLLTETGVAVLEIGHMQAASVMKIASEQGFAADVRVDLAGRDRAIVLRLKLGKGESNS